MGEKITIPKITKTLIRADSDINLLCNKSICNGDSDECILCAFYSEENFNQFIKSVGL